MNDLGALKIWCEAKIDMMSRSLDKRFISKHRKEMVKGRIMGYDEIIAQIRKMELGKKIAKLDPIDLALIEIKKLYRDSDNGSAGDFVWDSALDAAVEVLKRFRK